MSERKNIDRLFQEKFRDFEVAPDEKVWLDIEARLKEKKKRRVIPIWWKLSGVAALLLIGLLVFGPFTGSGISTPDDGVVNTDSGNSVNGSGNPDSGNTGSDANSGTVNPGNSSGQNNGPAPNSTDSSVAASGPATDTDNIPNEREVVTNPRQDLPNLSPTQNKKAPFKGKKQNVLRNTNNAVAATSAAEKAKKSSVEKTGIQPDQGVAAHEKQNTNQGLSPDGVDQNHFNTSQNKTITNDKLEVQTPQNTGIAANDADVKKDSAAVATAEPNVLEELLNEKENNVTSREQKINRWQITSNVAPIYFSSVSNGSPLDSRFEGNKKSYAPSLSYGVGAKYAINDKFSIKSGVNAVALEYNTNGIVFFQTENARMIENVKPNVAGAFIQVETTPENNAVMALGRERNQYSGEVNQKIGYVEIPVEMSYKLIDKKFGVELIGGMSTLILNRNEVSLLSPGMDMQIGEANNLNPVHFSTNLGVGFKYNFMKSFQANLEPMFKYQINTFSNDSGNFKPYFFGLYTGVSYRF